MGFGWSTHAVLLVLVLPAVLGSVYPEQVHLSYTDKPSEMVVTWVTQDKTKESKVRFGQSSLEYTAEGHTTTFVDGGSQHRKIYIHRARLHGLKPGESYVYVVGGPEGWSKQFNFRAMKDGSDWSPKMMVYGDMGSRNDRALPYLQHNAHTGHFDAVLHVGDFAYDMHDDDARVGDDFMRQIEPIAAYVPYMTCVGNHEIAYDFGNYRHRFTMPGGDGTGMYFSWNIGPAHIISFNTEVYYYQSATQNNIRRQYDWLQEDLRRANQPANRRERPWIITMGHRPMYCSNDDDDEMCRNPANPIRNGTAAFWPNLEDLFYKYGVDVEFYAHEHSYERLLPVYKGKVCGGSSEPYTNPRAPVHIITGSAGDKEGQDRFQYHPAAWSAFRSDDYGFTVMDIVNSTHLTLHQVSSDKGGQVIDSMVLIKEKHGAGSYTCE
ncbi:LOW QUALITY PROTEIN: acid phosphatase type 7-like [Pomacea canaliculata]|uniref:LOW QUALITY PROTEIN: acid phosphatase type 7-like n=1 Tax=Pomacea canaliculata TaxID=400727 RepID=UPI000D72ECB3|nr:LOW QUALITY PROTEIN: acid phosphatase type 7-like [Pomacea canaliculata]